MNSELLVKRCYKAPPPDVPVYFCIYFLQAPRRGPRGQPATLTTSARKGPDAGDQVAGPNRATHGHFRVAQPGRFNSPALNAAARQQHRELLPQAADKHPRQGQTQQRLPGNLHLRSAEAVGGGREAGGRLTSHVAASAQPHPPLTVVPVPVPPGPSGGPPLTSR